MRVWNTSQQHSKAWQGDVFPYIAVVGQRVCQNFHREMHRREQVWSCKLWCLLGDKVFTNRSWCISETHSLFQQMAYVHTHSAVFDLSGACQDQHATVNRLFFKRPAMSSSRCLLIEFNVSTGDSAWIQNESKSRCKHQAWISLCSFIYANRQYLDVFRFPELTSEGFVEHTIITIIPHTNHWAINGLGFEPVANELHGPRVCSTHLAAPRAWGSWNASSYSSPALFTMHKKHNTLHNQIRALLLSHSANRLETPTFCQQLKKLYFDRPSGKAPHMSSSWWVSRSIMQHQVSGKMSFSGQGPIVAYHLCTLPQELKHYHSQHISLIILAGEMWFDISFCVCSWFWSLCRSISSAVVTSKHIELWPMHCYHKPVGVQGVKLMTWVCKYEFSHQWR